eukprot:gene32981-55543_t
MTTATRPTRRVAGRREHAVLRPGFATGGTTMTGSITGDPSGNATAGAAA